MLLTCDGIGLELGASERAKRLPARIGAEERERSSPRLAGPVGSQRPDPVAETVVSPEAVQVGVADRSGYHERSGWRPRGQMGFSERVLAALGAHRRCTAPRRSPGDHVHDAAEGRAAVESRGGTFHPLDALSREQIDSAVEVRRPSVGLGGGDSVGHPEYAARSEGRSDTGAANGDAQVVHARDISCGNARHEGEQLHQIEPAGLFQHRARDDADRRERLFAPRRGDGDAFGERRDRERDVRVGWGEAATV